MEIAEHSIGYFTEKPTVLGLLTRQPLGAEGKERWDVSIGIIVTVVITIMARFIV